jgi:glutamate-1-semialdehyde 2,1-aminomutase
MRLSVASSPLPSICVAFSASASNNIARFNYLWAIKAIAVGCLDGIVSLLEPGVRAKRYLGSMMRNQSKHIIESFIERYHQRTPRSAAHYEQAVKVAPGGVNSNLRAWEPYPLYFTHSEGARIWDLDDHVYLDCAAAQGVLLVGHRNPVVLDAVRKQLEKITIVGASHPAEAELCQLILERYPCHDQVRLTNSGSEAVLHAIRLARAATGREKILKAEGTYHGNYDPLMVSFTPEIGEAGLPAKPNRIPVTAGLTCAAIQDTVIIPFNDAEALAERMTEHAAQVAAVILEPVILNMGCTTPKPGYLQAVRKLCDRNGALLIFDEAKTGAKIAYGGGPEYSGVSPDITCLAKAIGGGFPIGAIAGSRELMKLIESGKVWQTGSFAANPVSVAAAIATLRDVLTPGIYPGLFELNEQLAAGYRDSIARHGLRACVQTAGATGAVLFTTGPVRNYRDAIQASQQAFMTYWYGMIERDVIPQSYGRDDAWTLTLSHTEENIRAVISAFEGISEQIACVQSESREVAD